jgi:hypothetical protein
MNFKSLISLSLLHLIILLFYLPDIIVFLCEMPHIRPVKHIISFSGRTFVNALYRMVRIKHLLYFYNSVFVKFIKNGLILQNRGYRHLFYKIVFQDEKNG